MDARDYQNIEQGSDAWKNARNGLVTASRVADVVAKTKSGYSAQAGTTTWRNWSVNA
jgi:hypothetical protein